MVLGGSCTSLEVEFTSRKNSSIVNTSINGTMFRPGDFIVAFELHWIRLAPIMVRPR
jgi:hypothetical protein